MQSFEQTFPEYKQYYEKLDILAHLVEQKSQTINITAIRDYINIWEKHILDSLMCTKIEFVEEQLENAAVLDLGTGGGFPGLPLAITHPESRFVLLDSTKKKLNVVEEFASSLNLKNVSTKWARSNEVEKYFEGYFDFVVARAVTHLAELIPLCAPFIKKTGSVIFYKENSPEELLSGDNVARKYNMYLREKFQYQLGESDRVILLYSKP